MRDETAPELLHGASTAPAPAQAVRELRAALDLPDPALVVFFCSPSYDRTLLAAAIREEFAGVEVVGCTSAGEISPTGYRRNSLVGVAFSKRAFDCAHGRIDDLSTFEFARGVALARSLREQLTASGSSPSGRNTFGFMLIDGMSTKEEHVVSGIYRAMGDIPLVGGSAGDGDDFGATYVFYEGEFHRDACVLMLLHTDLPFEVFRTQHFVPTGRKLVVTEAEVATRTVSEINGLPAGREYARQLGLEADNLSKFIFAAHPVMVRVGGEYYVRSIMQLNPDESITFACAIDSGIVVTLAQGRDLVENLQHAFDGVRAKVGPPQLTLGCDCLFRLLEMDQDGIRDHAAEVMAANNVVGLTTYGEQFHGMHLNQTFAGVAIGRANDTSGPDRTG